MASRFPPVVANGFRNRDRKISAAQENTTMLTKAKIAVCLALVIATASAATAAPRHALRQQAATARPAAARQVPARAFLSFGSTSSVRAAKPTYMTIQDIGFKENLGD
jgi:hypothetical protein